MCVTTQDRGLAEALVKRWLVDPPCEEAGYLELLQRAPAVLGSLEGISPERRAIVAGNTCRTIEGMATFVARSTDRGELCLRDLADLRQYCYVVAGIVGELLTALFLDTSPCLDAVRTTLESHAVSFGEGLQLVNVLKDSESDRRAGRQYLPPGVPLSIRIRSPARRRDLGDRRPPTCSRCNRRGSGAASLRSRHFRCCSHGKSLDSAERLGAGAKVSREVVAALLSSMNDALDGGRPAVGTDAAAFEMMTKISMGEIWNQLSTPACGPSARELFSDRRERDASAHTKILRTRPMNAPRNAAEWPCSRVAPRRSTSPSMAGTQKAVVAYATLPRTAPPIMHPMTKRLVLCSFASQVAYLRRFDPRSIEGRTTGMRPGVRQRSSGRKTLREQNRHATVRTVPSTNKAPPHSGQPKCTGAAVAGAACSGATSPTRALHQRSSSRRRREGPHRDAHDAARARCPSGGETQRKRFVLHVCLAAMAGDRRGRRGPHEAGPLGWRSRLGRALHHPRPGIRPQLVASVARRAQGLGLRCAERNRSRPLRGAHRADPNLECDHPDRLSRGKRPVLWQRPFAIAMG